MLMESGFMQMCMNDYFLNKHELRTLNIMHK